MIAIVDYDAGNIRSVVNALERLGVKDYVVTSDAEVIRSADKVLMPGVGDASYAMANLKARGLEDVIPGLRQPVLGICVGLQLLCSSSEEGNIRCLGIFEENVVRFRSDDPAVKIPHMGWNSISDLKSPLFKGISEGSFVYFVHSFHAVEGPDSIAVSDHGGRFSAALHKDNFYGVQFHPEKSGPVGAMILKNFIEL
ncbi:MAG: imidazole glycerol phosphate synthase subunit HisH [Bacteroidales bacterium]|nr:imidazole glycerol phosphate synthase subunit HisH [Bacteroidales bacterium]